MSHTPHQPDDVLSTSEAAYYCGVSAETIRRWIRTKGLPAYNTELGLNIRIRFGDLDAFTRQNNILLRQPIADDEIKIFLAEANEYLHTLTM
ncbi:MAG: helix-turn-helix domain-containing protein [Anaerolineales bacterium]